MPAVWTYPWGLYAEGIDDSLAELASRGIDAIAPATHYHSVRSMQPRTPDQLFDRYAGGCYFDPDPDRFRDTPIEPIPNRIASAVDPLGEITAVADDHGLAVRGWTVLAHNSRLGATYPEYRTRDAFDNPHEHAFCPSHDEVQAYYAGIVANLADYDLGEIELESVGYQSVFHGHDTKFGHPKRQVLTSSTEEWLLSQCFCDACHDRAESVDLVRAQASIQKLVRESFENPHTDPPALSALLREYPVLRDLFDFRANAIAELFARLADAATDVDLDYYLMDGFGTNPGDGWPAGVRLTDVERYCDRATALCYVTDPSVARDRIRTLKRCVDVPVDVGVTLAPGVIESESQFLALMEVVRAEATGEVTIYHHSLTTEAQLDWIERAVSGT